ncbi:MAG: hypothetical protein ABI995_02695 [Acidobacteriota bacterium]
MKDDKPKETGLSRGAAAELLRSFEKWTKVPKIGQPEFLDLFRKTFDKAVEEAARRFLAQEQDHNTELALRAAVHRVTREPKGDSG